MESTEETSQMQRRKSLENPGTGLPFCAFVAIISGKVFLNRYPDQERMVRYVKVFYHC